MRRRRLGLGAFLAKELEPFVLFLWWRLRLWLWLHLCLLVLQWNRLRLILLGLIVIQVLVVFVIAIHVTLVVASRSGVVNTDGRCISSGFCCGLELDYSIEIDGLNGEHRLLLLLAPTHGDHPAEIVGCLCIQVGGKGGLLELVQLDSLLCLDQGRIKDASPVGVGP